MCFRSKPKVRCGNTIRDNTIKRTSETVQITQNTLHCQSTGKCKSTLQMTTNGFIFRAQT